MRNIRILIALAVVALALVLAWFVRSRGNPAGIAFLPYGPSYETKPDFSRLEHQLPLKPADLMRLTPANITRYDQEQVDQIFARLTAGPIPDGPYEGDLFLPKGSSGSSRLAEIVGGVKGAALNLGLSNLQTLARVLWKGKVFYRNEGIVRNRVDNLALLEALFSNRIDREKVQRMSIHGQSNQLLFPAKTYCGQSLLDSRRESIIMDYTFADDLPGYQEFPDAITGRDGLAVKAEVRMVRPGFYLGRGYINGVFVLNTTLYNEAAAKAKTAEEDCRVGSRRMAASAQ
jgi:hypothetical protein